jgi:hypothetical protein
VQADDDTDPEEAMSDPAPQPAAGAVLWHVTTSLDGFVAGPGGRSMDRMAGTAFRTG